MTMHRINGHGGGRTGVILAAGFGSRLQGVSAATSLKPLTSVAGTPLLVRAIRSLEVAGCGRVVVVTGFGAENVESQVRRAHRGTAELIFAENARYDLKNGVSVLTAAPHVPGEFILMMADHVVGDEVMVLAGAHAPVDNGATLLVDYKLETIFDMDDATKVLSNGDQIRAIGKMIAEYDCVDTGVFVCTAGLMAALESVYENTGDASLSEGVQALADTGRMRILDIGDGFWQDVDTPEMLAHAERVLAAQEGMAKAAGF
ncbi:MAG: NTP transferase domain-containing protein [Myxococcota bacterium]